MMKFLEDCKEKLAVKKLKHVFKETGLAKQFSVSTNRQSDDNEFEEILDIS